MTDLATLSPDDLRAHARTLAPAEFYARAHNRSQWNTRGICVRCAAQMVRKRNGYWVCRPCAARYARDNRVRHPLPPPSPTRVEGAIAYVPLPGGLESLIDSADVSAVSGLRWRFDRYVVAYSRAESRTVSLHRFLMAPPPGRAVDHVNGNALDNRRATLRIASAVENQRNRRRPRGISRFKGVHWYKSNKKWGSQITPRPGRKMLLGLFDTEIEAAAAYDAAATRVYGEFACTNVMIFGDFK